MLSRISLRRARPGVESLEGRRLLTASVSGVVYHDANANGLLDSGESPIAGSPIQLRNSSGVVIASASTDAQGRYEFTTDRTLSTAPQTRTVLATFDAARTGWSRTSTVPQFDPSLGTLTRVVVTSTATLNADFQIENLDEEAGSVSASVNGTVTVSAAGLSALTSRLTASDSYQASPFDGDADFDGPGLHESGTVTRTDAQSLTLTSSADLARFTGTGSVTFSGRATSRGTVDGPGNLIAAINTTAGARVQVVYTYTPLNCIQPGDYTVLQTSQPSGFLDGQESRGGSVVPSSIGADVISVRVGTDPVRNNNFGEVRAAALSGYVFVDLNSNGLRDAGEPTGLGNVTIQLTGRNDAGTQSPVTTTTRADGSYAFTGLRPGVYMVTELTQPAGFVSTGRTRGNVTALSLGASVPDVIPDIVTPSGATRPENNFGKAAVATPRPQTPPPTPSPTPSKVNLLSSSLRLRRR